MLFAIDVINPLSSKFKFVHVLFEVTEAHECRAGRLVGQVAAHAGGVPARASVEQHAELVVVNALAVAADLAQVLLNHRQMVSYKIYLDEVR